MDIGGFGMRLATRLLAQKPEIGVLPMLYAATASGVKENDFIGPQGLAELGGYPGPAKRNKAAQDPALQRQLWEATSRATGLLYPV